MNKNEMPAVEKQTEYIWSEDNQCTVETEIVLYADYNTLQSYAEKVTKENKRLNLLLVAQSKDIVTARKVKEERDRAVELVKELSMVEYDSGFRIAKYKAETFLKEKD